MAERQYRTLTKRTVDRLSVNGNGAIFWDRDLPGFGVRVYPSGKKVFVVHTRAFGRSKRVSLGQHGDPYFSADHARKKATEIIARIKIGQPPVPPEPAPDPTVADLAERYQREYVAMHCKPLTITHYRLMLRKHIVPTLGERLVADIDRIQGHPRLSQQPAPHAHRGQPDGRHPGEDVQPRRRMGLASLRNQPVPGRAPLQGREARAVPHPRGALPARRGADRRGVEETRLGRSQPRAEKNDSDQR